MKITQDDVCRTYQYLSSLPPFLGWDMPDPSLVQFEVIRSEMVMGEYDADPHKIAVSTKNCDTWMDVVETVAHEMVHLICEERGEYTHFHHRGPFRRRARFVCKHFGWDLENF